MIDVAQFMADPEWAKNIPEMKSTTKARHLPTHEDCTHLEIDRVQMHLRQGGTLGQMVNYEERPGQIDMTGAIAEAFNTRQHLMIEAGTGVGKSLAYLIPSILWAWTNDTPVVVSTATRNLQNQLLSSDIPRALKILGDHAAELKVALLKGRTNYLCLKSVDDYFASGYWTLPAAEQAEMEHLISWLLSTQDGDLETYEGIDPSLLSRPGDECHGRKCPYYSRCFIYKARQRAAEAHLIIANHALTLSSDTSTGGILPAYGRVVFDEAHNLEEIATDQFSHEFSHAGLQRIVRRLVDHHKDAAPRVAELMRAEERLLTFLGKILPPKRESIRYQNGKFYWDNLSKLKELHDEFEKHCISIINYLRDAADSSNDSEQVMRLEADANRLIEFMHDAAFVISGDRDDYAFWVEKTRQGRKSSVIRLVAAPLTVSKQLKEALYEVKDSVVLCSATLRVGTDFRYMSKRLGCVERFLFLTATSPFDYLRQSLVLATDYLTDLSTDANAYVSELAALLTPLFTTTRGRGLVLFTSYEMMQAVARAAEEGFARAGITLYVQGEGLSREAMTRKLKSATEPTVLFGAQSFWEGVDVSGGALSCVVIARLPFAQAKDPIVEARAEMVVREGGNGFRDYLLPEAILHFRQGFGRLIRGKTDRGIVLITDPRLAQRNYGASFKRALPTSVHTITGEWELMARVNDFFSDF